MGKSTKGKIFRNVQFEDSKYDRVAISETDIENCTAKKDISIIDIDSIKKLLNSDNIIEDYNKYCDESAKRIANLDNSKSTNFVKILKEMNSDAALLRLIRESGYTEFTDKEELIKYINIKINMYNSVINSYIKMIEHNYKALKISEEESKKIINNLKSGKDISKTSDKIIELLEKNKSKWKTSWGADFRKFGAGKVFMNLNENVWDIVGNARSLYNMSTQWDVVILCHGTDITPGRSLTNEEKEFVEKYRKLAIKLNKDNLSKEDIENLEKEFTDSDKKILAKYKNINKLLDRYDINFKDYSNRYIRNNTFRACLYVKDILLGEVKKNWGFAKPLYTPYGTFRDVNECIRACIENGDKSIKIMACNPGHYELASDIKAMKNIKIDYQYYSVLIENSYISLTESVDMENKISNLLNKIKQKSSKIFNNILHPNIKFSNFKLPFISIKNKKPNIENKNIKTSQDLTKAYEMANDSIINEILLTQKNIDILQKAKELLKKK